MVHGQSPSHRNIRNQTSSIIGKQDSEKRLIWSDTIPEKTEFNEILFRGVCKKFSSVYIFLPSMPPSSTSINNQLKKNNPLLKLTGNILYDVNYQSRIDTPFADNNIYQHTIQTRIDAVIKDQYQFRIYITSRFGNSSYYRKYTDLNLQFNQGDFQRMIKAKVFKALETYANNNTNLLDSLKKIIDHRKSEIISLASSIKSEAANLKIVEEREKYISWNGLPNRKNDHDEKMTNENQGRFPSSFNKFKFSNWPGNNNSAEPHIKEKPGFIASRRLIEDYTIRFDSLKNELTALENQYETLNSINQTEIIKIKKDILAASNGEQIQKQLNRLGITDTILPKGYKILSAIQKFNIGRSIANYSELSVKNISLTGIQIEFNPKYYYALAFGKVDYRVHDYLAYNIGRPKQYLGLVRVGKKSPNGNHLIMTYYAGKKQLFNSATLALSELDYPDHKVAGITIEGLYKIGRNLTLVGEVAKSTIPYYSRDSIQSKQWTEGFINIKDRSNEAYAIKFVSFLPKTVTSIFGNLRYTGANFQSFSLYTTGVSQLRWSAKIEQPLFRKQLTIYSSIQKNDHSNPYVTTTYKSSSLLASFRASLRIPKWPVFSLGYFPSYQLIKTGSDYFSESRYFTLTGNANYNYSWDKLRMNSQVIFSRFYNSANDSGFVYYNSKNIFLNQGFFSRRLSLLINGSLSINTDYNIHTIENFWQFDFNKFISAGAGLKATEHSLLSKVFWGYSSKLSLHLSKIGEIQFMMETGYVPALNKQLVENKWGRLTYYKTF